MRAGTMVIFALTTTLVACGRERPPEKPEKVIPAEEVKVLSDEEKLRSLGPDASDNEVGLLCLRLRSAREMSTLQSDVRRRCARSLLSLAENSQSDLMSPDKWMDIAAEFGASSTAIAKTKRSIAARRSEEPEIEATSEGSEIENESYARREDVKQAKKFLLSLPAACGSHASASRDGTVTIRLSCEGNGNSMNGSIKIKDGIVTEVQ